MAISEEDLRHYEIIAQAVTPFVQVSTEGLDILTAEIREAHATIAVLRAGGSLPPEVKLPAPAIESRLSYGGAIALGDRAGHQPEELFYTTNDDGIHLSCGCGQDLPLGFHATIDSAREAFRTHVETAVAVRIEGLS